MIIIKKIPKQIELACNLIWASLAFGFVNLFILEGKDIELIYKLFAVLVVFLITYWIIKYLKEGKNWMRITNAVLTAISSLSLIGNFEFIDILMLLLEVIVVYLTFTKEANQFFKKGDTNGI